MPWCVPVHVLERAPRQVLEQVSQHLSGFALERLPKHLPEHVSGYALEHVQEHVPEHVPECALALVSERWPRHAPELCASEPGPWNRHQHPQTQTSKHVLERMPQHVSGRVLEPVPLHGPGYERDPWDSPDPALDYVSQCSPERSPETVPEGLWQRVPAAPLQQPAPA